MKPADAQPSKGSPHLDADALRDAVRRGISEAERSRVLLHFGDRCGSCWESLSALVKRPESSWNVRARDGSPDPVMLAVKRLVELELAAEAQGQAAVLRRLRPSHSYAACRVRLRPLGFGRLVVEESRHQALGQPVMGIRVAEAAWDAVCEPDLSEIAAAPARRLRVLARAHLASAHQMAGDLFRSETLFAEAEAELEPPDDEAAEIHATLLELRADLARAQGQHHLELHLLRDARKLLWRCDIPSRAGETLVRLGTAQLRFDGATATRTLRDALEEIEEDCFPRLQLAALHQLAAAQVRCRRYDLARDRLEEAGDLYDEFASREMTAQRCWLRGIASLHLGELEPAETFLRQATDHLLELGLPFDASMALTDLGQLYLTAERFIDLKNLARDFAEVLQSPEYGQLSEARLRKAYRIALSKGIPLRGLSELLKARKSRPRNWVH